MNKKISLTTENLLNLTWKIMKKKILLSSNQVKKAIIILTHSKGKLTILDWKISKK
jgi:hypothetical protein